MFARVWPFPQEAVWLSDPVHTKRRVVDRLDLWDYNVSIFENCQLFLESVWKVLGVKSGETTVNSDTDSDGKCGVLKRL